MREGGCGAAGRGRRAGTVKESKAAGGEGGLAGRRGMNVEQGVDAPGAQPRRIMQGMDEGAWERAVEQARQGEPASQVEALTLDGVVKCAQGKLPKSKLFASFAQLKRLSIANVGLSSLADFPSLPHLERLILSDNRIASGLEHLVYAGLKSLRELDLSNNKIQAVEDLKPLAELKLESLDLYECPVTRSADYRVKVFGMMKSLRFLDKTDVTGNERPESDEEEEESEEEEDVDDLNGDGPEVEGEEEEEGVEGDSKGAAVHEEDDEEGEEDEENEELEDEEEDEGGSYQEEVVTASSRAVAPQGQVNNENGSDEEEVEDEEDDNVEVQDIEEESEEEEAGEEDEEDAVVDEEEEEEEEEPASGAHVSTEGELEVQENEEDEEDENGELGEDEDEEEVEEDAVDNDEGEEEVEEEDEEEEEYGTKYLVQPIGQPEEDEGASDFEPGDDDDEEDEDFEDEEEDAVETVQEPDAIKQSRKRSRNEAGENEQRPAKH